jgi:hypothetical protein
MDVTVVNITHCQLRTYCIILQALTSILDVGFFAPRRVRNWVSFRFQMVAVVALGHTYRVCPFEGAKDMVFVC